ncbi:MAG: 1-acyl-sn-glycerol-3-phosphate acyltransferase [Desulfobacula sp.]|uniref:lysophospholipid acyltransferase family protein n=1 Tax=Desulfobacula sp. TaxID=2593537 RepID=UPI001D8CF584|nr:1-acyl-sn-glycerol-3-phosphate acyltransferase [Desulfobacula sp.]MBT3484640.1 1-acyl-sn-glycerol-3-phosphate acyltransferase [Desulfobacula sp.]MBT3806970.1 1-acyl-sn-glycerol-3-phosphate acyltransferase [Desulfobacula sp.]MBT4023663.1 1-acyl-sn-glycerol-3-phosphate acyltransferase [Desulfobacula sp.]MBT4200652.1 1-acyl-sn-glycerol-3-phosphate acyltransferase [Desulfobacula sp.]
MKKIYSIWLWFIGCIFFLFSFFILIFSMFLFPPKSTIRVVRFLFLILIRIVGIKLVVTGRQYIDPDHSYLIMGNHQSLFDIFVVPTAIPLCFVGVEAAHHFSLPVWGYLIRKWGNIPIQRSNLKSAISSLEIAKKTLISGRSIAILPEGHRTLTGEMAPFKKGPFHLAKKACADILPFGINGLFDYNQKGHLIINPGVVKVNIGKPIPYKTFKNLSVEELRENVFDRISNLSQ